VRALDGMASQNFAAFLVSLGESVIAMPLILPFNVRDQRPRNSGRKAAVKRSAASRCWAPRLMARPKSEFTNEAAVRAAVARTPTRGTTIG